MTPSHTGSAAVAIQAAPESADEALLPQSEVKRRDQLELIEARAEALSAARMLLAGVSSATPPAETHRLASAMARSANRLASAAAWLTE